MAEVEKKETDSLSILIVDDEVNLLRSLEDAFHHDPANWELHTASSPVSALEILKKTSIDLVVSDLRMSGMDGFQLLEKVRLEYPKIQFVLMTSYGSEQVRLKSLDNGAIGYIEKPFELDEFISYLRKHLSQSGFGGAGLVGFRLVDLIQLVGMSSLSVSLKVDNIESKLSGFIYFEKGEPFHAIASNNQYGESAFYELLAWDSGDVSTLPLPLVLPNRTIRLPLMHLLMEGMRKLDEKKRGFEGTRKSLIPKDRSTRTVPLFKTVNEESFFSSDDWDLLAEDPQWPNEQEQEQKNGSATLSSPYRETHSFEKVTSSKSPELSSFLSGTMDLPKSDELSDLMDFSDLLKPEVESKAPAPEFSFPHFESQVKKKAPSRGFSLTSSQNLDSVPSFPEEKEFVNREKLEELLYKFEQELGGALLSTSLWSKSAVGNVLGISINLNATALLNDSTEHLLESLPLLGRESTKKLKQVMLEVGREMYLFVIEVGEEHRWSVLADGSKVSLGVLRGMIIPETFEELKKALN